MVKINLLPSKEKITKGARRDNMLAAAVSIFTVFLVAALIGLTFYYDSNYDKESRAIEKEIKAEESQAATYKQVEDEVQVLKDRLAAVKELLGKSIKLSGVLKELSVLTPVNLQIKDITIQKTAGAKGKEAQSQTEEPRVTMNGKTTNRRTVVRFKEALESSAYFAYVDFESATTDDEGNINFTISLELEKESIKQSEQKNE